MSKPCACFQPERSRDACLKASHRTQGLSGLFRQGKSSEEQDQGDGERDTEKTWTGVTGISGSRPQKKKKRRKDFPSTS